MRCADCPDVPNGTRKRPVCCLAEGAAVRLTKAKADIVDRLAEAQAEAACRRRVARAAALNGSMLASTVEGFSPGAARFAAPLTPEETARVATRAASGSHWR